MTRLRPYSSAFILAAFTIALLTIGVFAGNEFTGAGLAVLGATVTRALDVKLEQDRAREVELRERRRDLDETRRLMYMAYMCWPDVPTDLASTLVNALAHHGLHISGKDAMDHLSPYMPEDGETIERAMFWMLRVIDDISEELDGPQPRRNYGPIFGVEPAKRRPEATS